MKRFISLFVILGLFVSVHAISPYLLIGNLSGNISSVKTDLVQALQANGFDVIGTYNPSNNSDFRVIVYTNDALINICKKIEDRGMLAAALKIGIRNHKGKIQVTMLNPEYLFYAYLRDGMERSEIKTGAMKIDNQAKTAMKTIASQMEPFGGDVEKNDLKKYKYMMGMPKFDSPVELKEFSSFSKGVQTISKNLNAKKGHTVKVYEIIDEQKQVAVFGVGLLDPDKGEAHFLSIIGEKNIAAMPYEIILQGDKASILHGRYRFASHWPTLTMGTFTKIMSSPGDVEEFLRDLTE